MAKVWLMKVYKSWFDIFIQDNVVGIDETGVDDWYNNLKPTQIEKIFSVFGRPGTRKRFFEDFTYNMSAGDIVIVGIGQATQFNVAAIAKITGDYSFDDTRNEIRHTRQVNFKVLEAPIPFDQWRWAKRIDELKNINEFTELVSQVLI